MSPAQQVDRHPTRWQIGRNVSLVLENSGSTARDHLASERTFLAYIRTSLTIASAGVALAQVLILSKNSDRPEDQSPSPFEVSARPLAACAIVLSLYVLIVGVLRFFSVQGELVNGNFPAARLHVGAITFCLGAIITLLFALLIAGRSTTTNWIV
ncbi:hypothetical protein K438DRAFT_1981574 [Mycena galopus ATCC 62051]|nr:hypothetical protein K438DRAFT_1981574 [Mycena galopus ATCC 62051]